MPLTLWLHLKDATRRYKRGDSSARIGLARACCPSCHPVALMAAKRQHVDNRVRLDFRFLCNAFAAETCNTHRRFAIASSAACPWACRVVMCGDRQSLLPWQTTLSMVMILGIENSRPQKRGDCSHLYSLSHETFNRANLNTRRPRIPKLIFDLWLILQMVTILSVAMLDPPQDRDPAPPQSMLVMIRPGYQPHFSKPVERLLIVVCAGEESVRIACLERAYNAAALCAAVLCRVEPGGLETGSR